MIFVLDDMMVRIRWFRSQWPNMHYAMDVPTALDMLRENEYEIIFLDNDLGGAPYVRGKDGDGIDAARVMAQEKLQTDAKIVVHSCNRHMAQQIAATLEPTHGDVSIIPFTALRQAGDNNEQ